MGLVSSVGRFNFEFSQVTVLLLTSTLNLNHYTSGTVGEAFQARVGMRLNYPGIL